jgi:membrane associated rhomboid family serine protease
LTDGPGQATAPECYRHPGREAHIRCQRCERTICPDCMTPAAVGFQCPSCVAEGRRTTRSGRTAYGGLRSTNPGATSLALIVANAGVWLAILATGWRQSWLVDQLAIRSRGVCTAADQGLWYPGVQEASQCVGDVTWLPGVSDGAVWQLLTNAFTHVDVWHIGFNMLALWVLGPQLEMVVGRARFLALYLLSALAGSTAVYWLTDPFTPTIGASGAVFGLMGALLVAGLKVRGNIQPLLFWIGLNFLITVMGSSFISWQGHLGGFLGGLAIMAVYAFAPRRGRTGWQLAGLGAIGVLLVAAVVVRTLVLV